MAHHDKDVRVSATGLGFVGAVFAGIFLDTVQLVKVYPLFALLAFERMIHLTLLLKSVRVSRSTPENRIG
jgi:hypothetical protein